MSNMKSVFAAYLFILSSSSVIVHLYGLLYSIEDYRDIVTNVDQSDSLLNSVTAGVKCSHFVHDFSPYAFRVYEALVVTVPLVFSWLPLDMSYCSYLVIAVTSLDNLPSLSFKVPANPRYRILLLTNSSFTYFDAYIRLSSLRRARFVLISQQYDEEEYIAFVNMSHLSEVNRDTAQKIFLSKITREHLMDFGGAKFSILAINNSVKSRISEPDKHGKISWMNGYELLLLLWMCDVLNLKPEVRTFSSGRKIDSYFSNGTLKTAGIRTEIANWKADAGVGGVWLRPCMMGSYDFHSPWEFGCFRYLVPRPKLLSYDWDLYSVPFTPEVWLIVLLCDLTVAAIFTIFSRSSPNPEIKKGPRSFFQWAFTTSFMMILLHFPKRQHGSLVPLFAGWVWTSFILVAAFIAELNSMFTSPRIGEKVDTVEGFLKKGYTYGSSYFAIDNLFGKELFDSGTSDAWKEWTYGRYQNETSLEDRVRRMETGKYVVPGESTGSIFFFSETPIPPYRVIKKYEAAGKCHQQFFSSIIFPFGSPYSKAINIATSRFRNGGILNSWRHDVLTSQPVLRDFIPRNVFYFVKDFKFKEVPLNIGSAAGAFFVLIAGHFAAFIAFLLEIYFAKKKPKIANYTD